jgi:putative transposase
MPDHLHGLFAFPWKTASDLKGVVTNWKRYCSRRAGIDWQRDFFDHRIRNVDDHADKWAYIRTNPVRAGLVESADEWPHVWFPDRIGWPKS